MTRCATYARISTSDKGQNAQVQVVEAREYAERCGWDIVEEIVDVISGAAAKRAGLERLRQLVWEGKVDVILIVRLDRLGRSLQHLLNLLNEFHEYQVALVSLKEHLDLSTSAGRLMFHIIAALAEFERDLIRERVCAGLAYAKSQGRKLGRPGLNVDVMGVRILRKEGLSCRAIGTRLGLSASSVHKLLRAEAQ